MTHTQWTKLYLCELTDTQTHSIIQSRTSGHLVHTAAKVWTVHISYMMYTYMWLCIYLHYKLRAIHMYANVHYTRVRVSVFMKWGATSIHKHIPHSTTYTTRAHTYVPAHALQFLCPHTRYKHAYTHVCIHTMGMHMTQCTHTIIHLRSQTYTIKYTNTTR